MTALIEGRFETGWPSRGVPHPARVVAIGDSSLTGEGLRDPADMWLARALATINERTGHELELVILARSGAKLSDVVRQARLVDEEHPDVVVVCVGTNDAARALLPSALMDYESHYRQLLRSVRGRGRAVVAAGVGNLAYSPALASGARRLLRPVGALTSWYVDRAIHRATAETEVDYLGTRALDRAMWADRAHTYGPDHFHPSALGHARWADHARPVLEAALAAAARRRSEPGVRSDERPRVPPLRQSYSYVRTPQGVARVRDAGGDGTVVVVMPDSPNVLEHHESSFRVLGRDFRVVGLEMPGAGYTDLHAPAGGRGAGRGFDYSLAAGARWILDVLTALDVERAILTASCVNGLYAAMAAQMAPDRVDALVLCQTPSLAQLKTWAQAQIPAPLRNKVVGDLIVRVARRPLAARWYRQVVAPSATTDDRLWFEDLAYEGFRYGSTWRLAPLVDALMREPDDRIGELEPPTYLLWGGSDGSHLKAGTDPATAPGPPAATRSVATGHFPDLEDPDTFALAVRVAAGLEDPTVFG